MTRAMSAVTLLGLAATAALAQQPAPPQQTTTPPLEVGAPAPDFTLPAATRFGALRGPVRLSDFQGKTVVLAFYFRSRSRG